MEEIKFAKNHNNFDLNISFLENFVNKDSQSITNGEFKVSGNNCSNTNDVLLMLVTDNANTLRLPNKKAKNLQCHIGYQKFHSTVNNDLEAFIELKKRSEYFDEFIIDYNIFLNNHTIYSPGPFIHFYKKKASFDVAIALCSIGAPDIPKNFAQRSEMENMVF